MRGWQEVNQIGTGALVSMILGGSNFDVTALYGSPSWTAQFYLYVTPRFQDTQGFYDQQIFDFRQNTDYVLKLRYEATQQFSPSLNKLELKMYLRTKISQGQYSEAFAETLPVSFGEWLLVTLQANHSTQEYTLFVQNYGATKLSDYVLDGNLFKFRVGAQSLTQLIKELVIWNSAIANTPQISTHKCRQVIPFTPQL